MDINKILLFCFMKSSKISENRACRQKNMECKAIDENPKSPRDQPGIEQRFLSEHKQSRPSSKPGKSSSSVTQPAN